MGAAPWRIFRFCPRCGVARARATDTPEPFRCAACGFVYFFNPATAVAALVLRDDGRALFIGFVDPGESAEQALHREVREEVRLELDDMRFLSSRPNDYPYQGTIYPVVDLVFVAHARDPHEAAALDGVASVEWLDPYAVDLDDLAFESMRHAVARYRRGGVR
jgi:NAD+ diphosphatase